MNLFSPSDPLYEMAKIVPRLNDVFTVGGHGTTNTIAGLDAKGLAEKIKQDPNYKENQPVALFSCNTGNSPNGLGQQLANELGAVVYAPDNLLWYYSDGSNPVIAPYLDSSDPNNSPPDMNKQGEMKMFTPQNNLSKEDQ